jgi:hypothetical protein
VPLKFFTTQWLFQNTMDELQYEPAANVAAKSAQETSQESNLNEVVDQ